MERNRDLRSDGSAADGGPRRRGTVVTVGDSANDDRQMELKETVRFIDREQVRRMNGNRDLSKRRWIANRAAVPKRNGGGGGGSYREVVSLDSSDEEYFEEEVETKNYLQNRTNQLPP
ncbi:ATP binding protein [Striga asiatica]|uniref:ATP binding protein n=1 Tax=Striga asiatica TaxID=4170 RepID=A0A5A7PNC7_STRAF|nr:ATP binding protein [Striga asiatica]